MPFSLYLAAAVCAVVILVAAVVLRRKKLLPGPAPVALLGNVPQIDPSHFHEKLESVRIIFQTV